MIRFDSHRQMRQQRGGFTLVEMLMVMFVIGLVVSMSMPFFVLEYKKAPIAQATADIMDGLNHAREMAILNRRPMEFVLSFESGSMSVRPSAEGANRTYITPESNGGQQREGFSASLSPEVMVEAAQHNLDPRAEEQQSIAVVIQPKATADLFMIALKALDGSGERRLIRLDMVTGKAVMESDPNKFKDL